MTGQEQLIVIITILGALIAFFIHALASKLSQGKEKKEEESFLRVAYGPKGYRYK